MLNLLAFDPLAVNKAISGAHGAGGNQILEKSFTETHASLNENLRIIGLSVHRLHGREIDTARDNSNISACVTTIAVAQSKDDARNFTDA